MRLKRGDRVRRGSKDGKYVQENENGATAKRKAKRKASGTYFTHRRMEVRLVRIKGNGGSDLVSL